MAGGVAISALAGQMFLLPFAMIPPAAGVGIKRRRAWSAYGFALFTFAQLLPVALVLVRSASRPPGTGGALVLAALLIPLFLFAGRSLSQWGRAWPWIALSALTTIPAFFVQAFIVPSGSMEDTLLPGDRVLVQRFPRPSPARGDMIVFVCPIDRRQTFVKRVIGVPGDRIRISGKVVYRNGAAVDEPYAVHRADNEVADGEVVVPQAKYFVLGDNRDQSLDSRDWGFIDSGDLIGKPLMIYDSEELPPGPRRVRWGRIFKVLW